MTNGITLYEKIDSPVFMENIEKIGNAFAKAGMLGVKTDAQGQVMAMTCLADGISPVEFARRYHIVEGRLSMKADAMLARYQELGGKVIWLECTDKICRGRWVYNGNDIEISFTIDDAHRAGLCGENGARKKGQDNDGNWQKYPDAMLRARCTTKAIRMLAPQVNAGVYTPEEIASGSADDLESRPVVQSAKRSRNPRANVPSEPREVAAAVIDDASPPSPPSEATASPPEIDLSDIEDDANAYLIKINLLKPGMTWRDLIPEHVARLAKGMTAFRQQAANHAKERKESVDA